MPRSRPHPPRITIYRTLGGFLILILMLNVALMTSIALRAQHAKKMAAELVEEARMLNQQSREARLALTKAVAGAAPNAWSDCDRKFAELDVTIRMLQADETWAPLSGELVDVDLALDPYRERRLQSPNASIESRVLGSIAIEEVNDLGDLDQSLERLVVKAEALRMVVDDRADASMHVVPLLLAFATVLALLTIYMIHRKTVQWEESNAEERSHIADADGLRAISKLGPRPRMEDENDERPTASEREEEEPVGSA